MTTIDILRTLRVGCGVLHRAEESDLHCQHHADAKRYRVAVTYCNQDTPKSRRTEGVCAYPSDGEQPHSTSKSVAWVHTLERTNRTVDKNFDVRYCNVMTNTMAMHTAFRIPHTCRAILAVSGCAESSSSSSPIASGSSSSGGPV